MRAHSSAQRRGFCANDTRSIGPCLALQRFAFIAATILTLSYLVLHDKLPRLFSSDPEVLATASSTMLIVCAFLPFDHIMVRHAVLVASRWQCFRSACRLTRSLPDAFQAVLSGIFRGLGKQMMLQLPL